MSKVTGGDSPRGIQGKREAFLRKVQADVDKQMKKIQAGKGQTPMTIGNPKPMPKNYLD